MSIINNLTQFIPGTKALAGEINDNFETLRQGHNNHENRVETLESSVSSKFDKSGGALTGALHQPESVNIQSLNGVINLNETGNSFAVDGTENITSITGWTKGIAIIRWASSRVIQNSSNLILQNSTNKITNAGDIGIYEFSSNTVREINYFPFTPIKSNNFKAQTVLFSPRNTLGYADFIKKVEYSADVIPLMTSNTHTDCIVSASSQYDVTNVPWRACDNSNLDATCFATLTGVPTGWFKLKFTNPKKAIALALTSRNSTDATLMSPKDFIIEGSNDDINYTFLGTWTNITGWLQNEKRLFAFSNQNIYKYYKISILLNNGATYTGFGEIELFEALNDISPLNVKIDCNSDNPIIINFSKGYNLNGKSNDIGIIQQAQSIIDLLDNTLTYLAAEKSSDGTVNPLKTTAGPSCVLAKQKYSDFNSIPRMYSYTSSYEFTSGYFTSASSQTSEVYASWKAYDKTPASKWMAATVGGNQYLQIDFPNKRKAARFGVRSGDTPGQNIKNGYIKGWDGTGWRILTTITNQINWIAYEMRYFDVSDFYDCSKFKLEITDINNMADYAAVAELEIFELAHCYVIPENKMYLFNPVTNNYDEKQVVFIGKVYTSNGLILDARTFAQNGKYRSQETDLTISNIYNFYHNLGLDYKNIKISGWIKDKINGSIMPWCVDSSIDYTYEVNNYGFVGDDCKFIVRTVPTLMQYKDIAGANKSVASNVSLILEIERNFE